MPKVRATMDEAVKLVEAFANVVPESRDDAFVAVLDGWDIEERESPEPLETNVTYFVRKSDPIRKMRCVRYEDAVASAKASLPEFKDAMETSLRIAGLETLAFELLREAEAQGTEKPDSVADILDGCGFESVPS